MTVTMMMMMTVMMMMMMMMMMMILNMILMVIMMKILMIDDSLIANESMVFRLQVLVMMFESLLTRFYSMSLGIRRSMKN